MLWHTPSNQRSATYHGVRQSELREFMVEESRASYSTMSCKAAVHFPPESCISMILIYCTNTYPGVPIVPVTIHCTTRLAFYTAWSVVPIVMLLSSSFSATSAARALLSLFARSDQAESSYNVPHDPIGMVVLSSPMKPSLDR